MSPPGPRANPATTKKLEAVRRGEWWPLNGSERRAMARALAGGAHEVARRRGAGRAEQRMDTTGSAAEIRLDAELTALHGGASQAHHRGRPRQGQDRVVRLVLTSHHTWVTALSTDPATPALPYSRPCHREERQGYTLGRAHGDLMDAVSESLQGNGAVPRPD